MLKLCTCTLFCQTKKVPFWYSTQLAVYTSSMNKVTVFCTSEKLSVFCLKYWICMKQLSILSAHQSCCNHLIEGSTINC